MKDTTMIKLGSLVTVIVLSGCGIEDTSNNTTAHNNQKQSASVPTNTDPRKGWVHVWGDENTIKRCDGNNLVYRGYYNAVDGNGGSYKGYSITVSPNDKSCVR